MKRPKQKRLADFPWTLTQLAANLDIEFRTAMNWRSGLFRIPPSVKVSGKAKLQFNRADAAKFIIVSRLLQSGLSSATIQQFLDYLDEHKILFPIFPPSVPPPGELRNKFSELAIHHMQAFFLIAQAAKDADAFIVVDDVMTPSAFLSLVREIAATGAKFSVLRLLDISRELTERVEAIENNREYKAPDVGEMVRAALTRTADENRELGLPLNTPPLSEKL